MKMGEIRVGHGCFEMMTPGGLRPVTLRCRDDGTVMVEEVAGGGMTVAPLRITQLTPTVERARRAADALSRNLSPEENR